jgi:acetolactate synthase-1/2/3 large subunit
VEQTPRVLASPARPDLTTIHQIAVALDRSQRPLLIAGGGTHGATEQVRALADLGIRTLTTVNGKGVLDESHASSLSAGLRLPAAQTLVNDADLLLVAGSELGDSDLWGGTIASGVDDRTVVRIDVDPAQLHKNIPADIAVLGDARTVLAALLDALGARGFTTRSVDPAGRASINANAEPEGRPWVELQRSLHRALPQDTVIAGDASRVTYYGTVHFWPLTPAGRLLYPTGFSPLGYGLPAAIGAKIASPERPVVALFGDGAAMFSIQELITATEQRLPIPIIIADNGGYGEIRAQMIERQIQTQAVDLLVPDIPALAEAIGAIGLTAKTADEVALFAAEALSADRPTVIYHRIDES